MIDKRDEELKKIPFSKATPDKWKKEIRIIGLDELDNLGIDKNAKLYWNGESIVTEKHWKFSREQRVIAWIVAIAAILSAIPSFYCFVISFL